VSAAAALIALLTMISATVYSGFRLIDIPPAKAAAVTAVLTPLLWHAALYITIGGY
jgi:hypothetical protein